MHTWFRRLFLLAVVMLLSLSFAFAGGEAEEAGAEEVAEEGITIGYSSPGLDAFQAGVMYSVIEYAQEKGWSVIPQDANRDAQQQANQIEYLISLGVDAIVAVPVDSQAFCSSVTKAENAGIPVYTIDRAPIGCEVNMTVQADNVTAGRQSGEAIVGFLEEKYGEVRGTVLELQGEMAQNVAQLRHQGFIEVMEEYPNIEVISKPTNWDSNKFYQNTVDVVGSQDVDAIYMHSDSAGATPVVQALNQIGKLVPAGEEGHIYVAAIDGTSNALDLIRAGSIDQTSSQPNPDFGLLTNYIEMELNGKEIEPGPVVEEDALWSPAEIRESDTGLKLNLSTTSVTSENVGDPRLWGNQQ